MDTQQGGPIEVSPTIWVVDNELPIIKLYTALLEAAGLPYSELMVAPKR